MKQLSFTPIFALPIGVYDSGLDAASRAALVAMIDELRLIPSGRKRSSVGGWRSEGNIFDINVDAVRQLAEAAIACSLDYLEACGVPFDRSGHTGQLTGWANVNGRGHYNAPHRHPGHDLSGCFYLVQPKATADATDAIVFLDHRNLTREVERFGGPMFSTSFTLRPEPGQIVIFPSSLMHWVRPNQTDEDRIVIAWNLDVVEKKGASHQNE